jgi:phage tail-like protein
VATVGGVGARTEAFVNYLFRVDITGIHVADFSECTGLEVAIADEKFNEGGRNEMVRHLPGRVTYTNLTLNRGYVRDSELFTWCMSMLRPREIQRRDVSISLMRVTHSGSTAQSTPIFTWTLHRAFPVKWSGPSFRADASGNQAVAMERLELAFESMD